MSPEPRYVVAGRCDGDCADLDLRLTTSSGAVVDNDQLPDSHPEVSVRPSRTRNYSVEVEMYRCRVEPCYYGIALFER